MSDRDKAKSGELGGVSLIGAVLLGGATLLAKHASSSSKNDKIQAEITKINNQIQSINSQIADIDREINNYKNEFLGSWLNDTKIEELERKRSSLVQERTKYEELLNKY